MTQPKHDFLVVYDYGQGGLWAIVTARFAEEIKAKFPVLSIVDERPEWMDEPAYERVASSNSFDVDGAPPEWLVAAMKEQK